MTIHQNTSRVNEKSPSWEIKPNTLMGQHFLVSRATLKKIIDAANLDAKKTVLEVGAGDGVLTYELARLSGKVVAVEKDKNLALYLRQGLTDKEVKNVFLVEGDILKIPFAELGVGKKYSLVGNIPYYLTSRLIRRFLESDNPPEEMFLMIQKEVAERIVADPPRMNLLALSVQVYAKPKILFFVPPGAFHPQPKVDSAFIAITEISENEFREGGVDKEIFFKVARAAFQTKRKTLANSLANNLKLAKGTTERMLAVCGIDSKRRAETVSIKEWLEIAKVFSRW